MSRGFCTRAQGSRVASESTLEVTVLQFLGAFQHPLELYQSQFAYPLMIKHGKGESTETCNDDQQIGYFRVPAAKSRHISSVQRFPRIFLVPSVIPTVEKGQMAPKFAWLTRQLSTAEGSDGPPFSGDGVHPVFCGSYLIRPR